MTALRQSWRRPLEIALWSPTDSHKEVPKIASLVVSEVRAHARAQQPLPDDELPHSPIPAHPAVGDSRDSLAVSLFHGMRQQLVWEKAMRGPYVTTQISCETA
jgi:hypothetical protein